MNATSSSTPSSGTSIAQANSTTNAPILTTTNLVNKTDLHTSESKPEAYLVHLKPKKRSRNKQVANAKNKYLLLLRLPEDHTAAGSSVDQQQRSVDDFSLNDDQQQQSGGFQDAIQTQDNGDDQQDQQNDQQSNNLSNQEEDQGFDDISQFARSKPTESFGQRTSLPSSDFNQQQQQQINEPQQQQQQNDQFDDNISQSKGQQQDQPTYFQPIKSTKQINRAPASYVALGPQKGTEINYKTEIQHDVQVQQQQNNDYQEPPQQQQQQNDDFSAPVQQQQNDDFSSPVSQQDDNSFDQSPQQQNEDQPDIPNEPVQQNNDYQEPPPSQQNEDFNSPPQQQQQEETPQYDQQPIKGKKIFIIIFAFIVFFLRGKLILMD